MTKENILIDKSGSTIKYSTEGPDIEDLELEEEDVVVSPATKIKKFLQEIDSKIGEQIPFPEKEKKKVSLTKEKRAQLFLKIGNPKKDYKLHGSLKKFHYIHKNFHYYFWLVLSVKTTSLMKLLEKSLNTHIACTKIVVNMNDGQKPSVFTCSKNTRSRKMINWDIAEFIMGASRGERTQIKIKIS